MSRKRIKDPRRCGPIAPQLAKRLKKAKVANAEWWHLSSGHFKVRFTWLDDEITIPFAGSPTNRGKTNHAIIDLEKALKRAAARHTMRKKIDAAKTPNGGYRRADLEALGVPWPPPQGWKQAAIDFAGDAA